MIPGLERAEFVRYGQMHRNTFLTPGLLEPPLVRGRPGLFFGGQLTGTEGYVASAASGLVAGVNAARTRNEQGAVTFPAETASEPQPHIQ